MGAVYAALQSPLNRVVALKLVSGVELTHAAGTARVFVRVRRLATPGHVRDGTSRYVVWVRGLKADDVAKNVGTLDVDESGDGRVEFTIPAGRYSLFLTPETFGTATEPAGNAVMSTQLLL
jgi:hypothetical protein